ncbi:aspartate kinase [Aquimarina sp. BL5]|uniref:aspartate kinase n=1 Tax=Aquimarina sp. BL5 TaxID=1714860 RepID=UPI000E52D638|nr:aspartate kinase [Aquimarina sp. BL5]AXT51654.1 aspartate kinase [Aquimarina sp. BL5]RKN08552.1 aspartate kinase [Aquimarina sp. BL5]
MKVFKFGGASVKDAKGVKNVIEVLKKVGNSNILIIVSAMGKTTNALEIVVSHYLNNHPELKNAIDFIKKYHIEILKDLFDNKQHPVFEKVNSLISDMETTLKRNKSVQYDYVYDQIVCYGELIGTTVVSEYLSLEGYVNNWLDAREVIKTDEIYRDATVNWEITQQSIAEKVNKKGLTITQGFIASDTNNFTTTLGREGSDYSAGIFAYCTNANSVSIWKDVPGVLNGDPRVFENTKLLSQISYEEAIELAFYGASVIHPKTLQPLQRKEIPLYVKSFINPLDDGTSVKKGQRLVPHIPCFIVKKDQILLSLSSLDFSFIVEDNISEIFSLFHTYQLKVDLIQNSAISFSVCLDDKFNNFEKLLSHLKAKFSVVYEKSVSLYTIRHFDEEAIQSLEENKDILLKQSTKETYQMVAKQ